jgi:hypothetical protein
VGGDGEAGHRSHTLAATRSGGIISASGSQHACTASSNPRRARTGGHDEVLLRVAVGQKGPQRHADDLGERDGREKHADIRRPCVEHVAGVERDHLRHAHRLPVTRFCAG